MQPKLYKTESKRNQNQFNLLPVYFKFIGLIICASSVVITIITSNSSSFHSELNTAIRFDIFITGLLFICLSRDKSEDELTKHIRLQSMASTFIYAVIYVMLRPFGNILFGLSDFTSYDLITLMIIWYLLTYYWRKYAR